MRSLYYMLALLLSFSAVAKPGGIRGVVVDEAGKPLSFALVQVGAAGDLTDKEGYFQIQPLAAGEQIVQFSYSGLAPLSRTVSIQHNSVVDMGKIVMTKTPERPAPPAVAETREYHSASAAMAAPPRSDSKAPVSAGGGRSIGEVNVRSRRYERPLVEPRAPASRTVLTDKEIEKMPTRSPADAAATAPGTYSGRGDKASVAGGRGESTSYVVDGIAGAGSRATAPSRATSKTASVPPARHDDATSSVVSVTAEGRASAMPEKSEAGSELTVAPPPSSAPVVVARGGLLTSGESNDFSKWKLWEDMVGPTLKEHEGTWKLYLQRRYSISVQASNGAPLVGAQVRLFTPKQLLWEAVTDNTGRAELWAGLADSTVSLRRLQVEVIWGKEKFYLDNPAPFGGNANIVKTTIACNAPSKLDIAFLVDATGSMGDEISYLKAELTDILQKVQDSLPKLDVQTAAVFYQDLSDQYVTDAQDFKQGIKETVSFIGTHGAQGGGDFPEAVDMALDRMLSGLTWREGTVAKIAFLVLDAPPHSDPVTVARIQELTAKCAAKSIRLVPVACSGVDKSTEYVLRSMALATNGTYLFLTNHSGIGGSHIEPTTDRYEVEYLNGLVYRVIHQFSYLPECGSLAKQLPDTGVVKQAVDSALSVRWKFFPNPTSGMLNVEYDGLDGEFYVCDISGKAILRFEADKRGRTRIDLTQYPSGVYFLRYQYAPEKWLTGRFVVAH